MIKRPETTRLVRTSPRLWTAIFSLATLAGVVALAPASNASWHQPSAKAATRAAGHASDGARWRAGLADASVGAARVGTDASTTTTTLGAATAAVDSGALTDAQRGLRTTTTTAAPTTTAKSSTTTAAPTTTAPAPSGLTVGWTHGQYSADPWWSAASVASAEQLLRQYAPIQNQHIMGFGTISPEPSPGSFDWSSLDGRVALMRKTGATPVITLCCAPDWMKGGAAGTTDWSRIEVAPTRAQFPAFAQLSAEVAKRYPDVKYFQVWNELKGFYDPTHNRWDYEAYTDLYNQVYDAVKAVRPDAQLGGPYVVLDSFVNGTASNPSALTGSWGVVDQRALDVIDYWLAHAHGAQFLSLDATINTKGGGITTDANTATQKFTAIMQWVRQRTTLPVWWSEFYPIPASVTDNAGRDAAVARGIQTVQAAGASVVLLWSPNGDGGTCFNGCLWTDIRNAGGGQPTSLTTVLQPWARL